MGCRDGRASLWAVLGRLSSVRRGGRPRRLGCERLEERQMLSAGGAADTPVRHLTSVHEYLAQEAGELYRTLYGVSGVALEYEGYLASEICPAVVDEDDGLNSLNHFCEGGDGGELTDGYLFFDSAYTKASETNYPRAVDYYHSAAKSDAYYWLGRTLHLLQDMTVPAHVHNDQHALGDDEYEDNVGDYAYCFDFNGADGWDFQDWDGDWSSAESLWDRGDDYGSLEALFRETTDYTDDYDSDDYPGDWHNSTTGDYFPLTRLDELDRAYHATWANDYVTGNGSELSPDEVHYLARDLGTWAVEQGAMLMRFFLDDVNQVVASPAAIHAEGTSSGNIEIGWNGVAGAEGYAVYRSTEPSSGFGYVENTSSSYYEDTGLAAETTYYYRVYAYNDVAGLGTGYASTSASTAPLLPGDADRNGQVDEADAAILAAHWGTTSGASWEDGDFNEDGRVDAADAAILAAHWGATSTAEGESSDPSSSPDTDTASRMPLVGPLRADESGTARRSIRSVDRAGAGPSESAAAVGSEPSSAGGDATRGEELETPQVQRERLAWAFTLARRQAHRHDDRITRIIHE